MMRRLRTGTFRTKSNQGNAEGVTQLERVESLLVKHEQSRAGADVDDTLLGEASSPIFNVDYYQDARRQVYNESLLFRNTPFYASKVHLEQRFDEHHLLRMHLAALERSERNGPILMPDEFLFLDATDIPPALLATTSLGPHAGGALQHLTSGFGPAASMAAAGATPLHRASSAELAMPPLPGAAQAVAGSAASSAPFHSSAVTSSIGHQLAAGTSMGRMAGEGPGGTSAVGGDYFVFDRGQFGGRGDRHMLGAGGEVSQVSNVGGEMHVLNWRAWVQRQRQRGWFNNETLFYMTILGGIVGAGNFTTFWSQLQIWKSSMFFIPFVIYLFLVGIPAIQLEILMGNLFRGAPLKEFTQISHKLVGAGVLTFVSCLVRIILLANRSAQLVVYFIASVNTPHPWELTTQDIHSCLILSGHKFQCEATMHGTLCHYIDEEGVCMASPTGKATYYYLKELQPSTIDKDVNPDRLQGKFIGAVAFVWLYILAYIWRGLFKLGFLSAILMFVAGILCVTLMLVCFFGAADSGRDIGAIIRATFNFSQLLSSFQVSRLTAAVLQFVFQDLSLGCGIFGTVGSFTKIGYNVVPSVAYATLLDFIMSLLPFAALLAVIGSIKVDTGVSVNHLVSKTRGATAYFVIFPAAFTRVSVPNLFAMFFFGGIFVLNTQIAAISFSTMISMISEARVFPKKYRKALSAVVILICFLFSIPFCGSNQQVRVDFFSYLLATFMIPIVILMQAIAIGWVNNYRLQIRLAGAKAYYCHTACCWVVTVVYVTVMVIMSGGVAASVLFVPIINSVLAAIFAFFFKEPPAAPDFATRFWALWLGNIEAFRRDVCRLTLFPPRSSRPAQVCLSFLKRVFCACCSRGPFFLCRPSMYWSFCVKYIIPVSTLLPFVQGLTDFERQWAFMSPSPNLRNAGLALVIITYVVAAGILFIPRVHWWVCPPPEDYMPIKMFPHHPYRSPPPVPLMRSLSRLFREFLSSSYKTSAYLSGIVTDYRLHQQRQGVPLRETGLSLQGAAQGAEVFRTAPTSSLPADVQGRMRSQISNDSSEVVRRPTPTKGASPAKSCKVPAAPAASQAGHI
ncbi:Sodium:neurotransmitter symporter family protein [Besnoitia besnoiti]|uniref:Sodium:neurotransmitter symporter family protein n=1 Tax=Besnoitia besnoiti TaxID=94643 RepID=A0A2A9M7B8_BESBE|nr:Sodium:neurotransmitter symporter family protein [Besnoitia besnoiti]PFH31796.1 Sodium:neurotransmitter symporter family protein [Besnoitia besnoiti]